MRLHDISPLISSRLAVWPGDTPASREVLLDLGRGDNLTLSTLHGTVHLGAHADAPSHYGAGASGIDERSLVPYLGRCRVIEVQVARGQRIAADAVSSAPDAHRVLLKTGTYPDPEHFNEDFAALSVELVERLHGEGVVLVGIDTPSVDLFSSKDLPAHQAFPRCDMAILEGLVLRDVSPGDYELIALPLRLRGFDASPVRAVLRELPEGAR
jgi:arylformamidase